jgi:hypothetical protein
MRKKEMKSQLKVPDTFRSHSLISTIRIIQTMMKRRRKS